MASYKKFIIEMASKYQAGIGGKGSSDLAFGQNEVYKEAHDFLESTKKNGTKKELVVSK